MLNRKSLKWIVSAIVAAFSAAKTAAEPAGDNALLLWYDKPAVKWEEALPQVRQLVNEGKYRDAVRLISAKVMAKPLGQMPYQTVGDLLLTFPDATNFVNYRRDLDFNTAIATVSYTSDGVRYTREVFASAPDHVIVVRLTTDKPGKFSFAAGMKTPTKSRCSSPPPRATGSSTM